MLNTRQKFNFEATKIPQTFPRDLVVRPSRGFFQMITRNQQFQLFAAISRPPDGEIEPTRPRIESFIKTCLRNPRTKFNALKCGMKLFIHPISTVQQLKFRNGQVIAFRTLNGCN